MCLLLVYKGTWLTNSYSRFMAEDDNAAFLRVRKAEYVIYCLRIFRKFHP